MEHQRTQIGEYVERVGTATIEHASLKLQITTLEGKAGTCCWRYRLEVLCCYCYSYGEPHGGGGRVCCFPAVTWDIGEAP